MDTIKSLFSGSVTLPTFGLWIAFGGLLFAVFQWWLGRRDNRRLAGIVCATHLEEIARICRSISFDYGSWNEPGHPGFDGNNPNHSTVSMPDTPSFEDIDHVSLLGTDTLNSLLSLKPLQNRISRQLSFEFEDDFPDFGHGFEYRRIFYAGFGVYIITLSKRIRAQVGAASLGSTDEDLRCSLIERMQQLVIKVREKDLAKLTQAQRLSPSSFNEDTKLGRLRAVYRRTFLPEPHGFWPTLPPLPSTDSFQDKSSVDLRKL